MIPSEANLYNKEAIRTTLDLYDSRNFYGLETHGTMSFGMRQSNLRIFID